MDERDELLRYYRQELTYLREMGEIFAARYPKVAGRLELGPDECPDPHVEHLIQSFAFLTGRIQHNIDSEFPEIATELLNLLYPHYLNPIPAMAMARFEIDPQRLKLTSGHLIPKHTPLFAQSEEKEGPICRFRTCYPVTLWPLEIIDAGFEPPDRFDLPRRAEVATVLRLRIKALGIPLAELELERLRFHLFGDRLLTNTLYELLFAHSLQVVIVPDSGTGPRPLIDPSGEPCRPRAVGFGPDEEVLPYPRQAHPAYRLLQEYFVFPEKFHFFELEGLGDNGAEEWFDVLILLAELPDTQLRLAPQTFALGCTPIVNLFARTSEPIRLDQTRTDYPLVADRRRQRTTAIHSILSVSTTSQAGDRSSRLEPFYAFDRGMERRRHKSFWHARRVAGRRPEVADTEIRLSFLDLDFKPRLPAIDTVFAHTLCTNRDLAAQIPAGGRLQCDVPGTDFPILCLKKPTAEIQPPRGGQTLWRLISHLSLNYLSLGDDEASLRALREILSLYSYSDPAFTQKQIMGIRATSQRKIVRRIGREAWRGFCRGTEVTLVFDESYYPGSSAFLLASVLNHFFALHASVNSFTELVAETTQQEGEWKRWPPISGERILR